MSKEREAFSFFRSFRDAVEFADPAEQLILFKAIVNYGLDGTEPDVETFSRLGQMCWTFLKPNLRSGFNKFVNGCKGGAPKGNQNARKTTKEQPKNKQKTTEKQAIYNENKNENKNLREEKDTKKKVATKRAAFVAPTRDALCAYLAEKDLKNVNPDAFMGYYESNGWRVGKNPMKDWRAAARNWNARHNEFANNKNTMHHETRPRYEAFSE